MKHSPTTCVVCKCPTVNQEFNESYDLSEYCCEACASQFYNETKLPSPSDCEDANLKEIGK